MYLTNTVCKCECVCVLNLVFNFACNSYIAALHCEYKKPDHKFKGYIYNYSS